MPTGSDTAKQETIDELGDLLDELSPIDAHRMFNKLTHTELLKLKLAIDAKIRDECLTVAEQNPSS